jgi:diguanylate cyclase (GGDEF)-like protein/PAS domain S-box-containing protein
MVVLPAAILVLSAGATIDVTVARYLDRGAQWMARIAVVALFLAGVTLVGILLAAIRRQERKKPDRTGRVLGRGRVLRYERVPVAWYSGPADGSGQVSAVSPELESLLGYGLKEWTSHPSHWARVILTGDRERVMGERARLEETSERLQTEYRVIARDGHVLWLREEAVLVYDASWSAPRVHGVLIDITEQKQAEEALHHQALHDTLTGLPNRVLLLDRLEQALRTARRTGEQVGLLLMDLDRFKEVNDTFGHRSGDALLRQVVEHLCGALRESDSIARLGGDEFAVLLPAVDPRGAVLAAHKLLAVMRHAFEIDGHLLEVGGSVGIALYPDHAQDGNTLLQRADVAMYVAKRSGTGYAVYEPEQDPHTPGRLTLVRELRRAIEADQLVLLYQPKASIHSGAAEHFEALVRWNHREQGLMLPERFVATAENAGLMKLLSVWVLNAALKQCQAWHLAGLDVSVAVNLSPRTLHDPDLVPTIRGLLTRWNVDPRQLEVEITETALMDDPAGAMETLTSLHGLGVCISIDDFGTGYSSLSYLTRLPADQIKIDKSFVLDMAENDDNAFIVRSVIDLGHNLCLQVVAEGVENQETWNMLASMGCDVAQGFHLSRPMPASEIPSWLANPPAHLACTS